MAGSLTEKLNISDERAEELKNDLAEMVSDSDLYSDVFVRIQNQTDAAEVERLYMAYLLGGYVLAVRGGY